MDTPAHVFPPLPDMTQSESYYGRKAKAADAAGDVHARAAFKVAQYIASALNPELPWNEKLRYFEHALKKHAAPPPPLDDQIWAYYTQLKDLVRTYAGKEAIRLATAENGKYVFRDECGEPRFKIRNDAIFFFRQMMPSEECPDWFHLWDFNALRTLRNQWA